MRALVGGARSGSGHGAGPGERAGTVSEVERGRGSARSASGHGAEPGEQLGTVSGIVTRR